MRAFILILSACGALTVSGCESAKLARDNVFQSKYNPFLHYSSVRGQPADVLMRADTGVVTPMSTAPQHAMTPYAPAATMTAGMPPMSGQNFGMSNSSVEVFDINGSSGFPVGGNGSAQQVMPTFGGGVLSSDSSVTIFSLDGAAPMMSGAPSYNSGAGYTPMNYAGNMGGGNIGNGNQIFFKHGSSHLGGGDMRTLSSVAEEAKFAPVNRVTVAGYASQPTQAGSHSVRGHILNLKESMNRAYAVSKTLMKKGVPAEKIKTVSWGATKPSGNDRQDRRVDVIMGEQ